MGPLSSREAHFPSFQFRHVFSIFSPLMASISAFGTLPKSSTLSPLKARSLIHPQHVSITSSSELRGFERREILVSSIGSIAGALWSASQSRVALATEFADMPALRGKDYGKTKMKYPDYLETESGLQYKDLRVGDGPTPKTGETVVVDWDGYTIGYYGRIFEARNKTKGGSFEGNDKDFFKFRIGSQEVIPAFEEAVSGMSPGGVRRC